MAGQSSGQVKIILCTRNGEAFLTEQLDSILKQTDADVRLLISDDASSDGTPGILMDYLERFPERISVRFRGAPSGGAARHFLLALKDFCGGGTPSLELPSLQGDAGHRMEIQEYVMFADQDDRWRSDKVRKTLDAMKDAERRYGASTPLLVHCDMRVVDREGQLIAPSYVRYQQMTPKRNHLNQLLVQNNVTGGAMMMNRALVSLLLRHPVPEQAVMHDHWIALTAAAFGQILYLDEALYDYRQHGDNAVGAAKGSRLREVADRLGLFRKDGKTKADMDAHSASVYGALFQQAAEFSRQYEEELSPENRRLLKVFTALPRMSRAGKIAAIRKYGFTFNRLHRTVGECLFL